MFVCIRRSQGTCFFFRSLMDAMSLLRTSATAYRLLIVLLSHFLSPPLALDPSLNCLLLGGGDIQVRLQDEPLLVIGIFKDDTLALGLLV